MRIFMTAQILENKGFFLINNVASFAVFLWNLH